MSKSDVPTPTAETLLSAIFGPPPPPLAPGPTLAELRREQKRADMAEMDAVAQRKRGDDAIAQLHDVRRELAALRAALGMAP